MQEFSIDWQNIIESTSTVIWLKGYKMQKKYMKYIPEELRDLDWLVKPKNITDGCHRTGRSKNFFEENDSGKQFFQTIVWYEKHA